MPPKSLSKTPVTLKSKEKTPQKQFWKRASSTLTAPTSLNRRKLKINSPKNPNNKDDIAQKGDEVEEKEGAKLYSFYLIWFYINYNI